MLFRSALARTLAELRQARIAPSSIAGGPANDDIAALLERATAERQRASAVDYATMIETATRAVEEGTDAVAGRHLVLLDPVVSTDAESAFIRALVARSATAIVTVASGDKNTIAALGLAQPPHDASASRALDRLQAYLFSDAAPPSGGTDDSVSLFSAPGEGREAVEIARRVMAEAARGVPFDDMAILLRAPQTYLSVLEHALDRAGIRHLKPSIDTLGLFARSLVDLALMRGSLIAGGNTKIKRIGKAPRIGIARTHA